MTNLVSSMGYVVLSLSLSATACTHVRSLGAVDDHDGGAEVQSSTDAVDVPGTVPRDVGLDVSLDLPVEQPQDAPVDVPHDVAVDLCLDNGVQYQVGAVIPRGSSGCPISCLCLAGGVIGRCTGACPADAAIVSDGPTSNEVRAGQDGPVFDAQLRQDAGPPNGCFNVYDTSGCGENMPSPRCVLSTPACRQAACSCQGQIIEGCIEFTEPFAYAFQLGLFPIPTGDPCDPHANEGRD